MIGGDLLDTGDEVDLGSGECEGGQEEEDEGDHKVGCLGEPDQSGAGAKRA